MNKDALIAQLRIDEDDRAKPYDDATGKTLQPGDTIKGNITISIGCNLMAGITPEESAFLVSGRIDSACAALDKLLPWWRNMSDRRQQVLANMAFNMGMNKLLGFVNTLAAMKQGRYADAAEGMLESRWAQQVGDRAKRLAQMMREG